MGIKDQIQDNTKTIIKIAAKIQADVNAAGMGPPGTQPADKGAALPHLTKPKHTTSYVLFISVPRCEAQDISAAIEFLRRPGEGTNFAVMDAILTHARSCGWDPD